MIAKEAIIDLLIKKIRNEKIKLEEFTGISLEELEKALAKIETPQKSSIKEPIFEDLKSIFGKDVEILMNY